MKFARIYFLVAIVWLLQSCFDSDDHIFDESEAIDIKVEAYLGKSISDISSNVKADTFHISDTIYFITSVSPNKIIKVQDYHWLMDGKYCSSEYNFKKQVTEPGHHKFTFVLKDYFGDMHYDSLDIWVADNPILNVTEFSPAEGTQALDPYETIYFTWSAQTEGVQLSHYYRFILNEQDFANSSSKFMMIDTILKEPHFIFHNKLNPFKQYNWTVQAFNEYNLGSSEKIESFFFTKGLAGEGSLQAKINIGNAISVPVQVTLANSDQTEKRFSYKFNVSSSNNEFSTGAIPAGQYQLTLKSDYPDFSTFQKIIAIHDGFVTNMGNITIIDSIPPSIVSVTGHDTLDFADTLHFIVKDGSQQISAQKTTARLEGEQTLERVVKDSILSVVLKETDKSWAYRILTISATDGSQNTSTKSFYIAPSDLWFTTNSDTTISSDDVIKFFIQDNNSFGFVVDTLKFFNVTKNKTIISIPNASIGSLAAELEGSLFDEEQTIQSIVIYKNGLQQRKTWKLYVTPAEAKEAE